MAVGPVVGVAASVGISVGVGVVVTTAGRVGVIVEVLFATATYIAPPAVIRNTKNPNTATLDKMIIILRPMFHLPFDVIVLLFI